MNYHAIRRQVQILERQFDLASTLRRRQMRSEVVQCVKDFRAMGQPVPPSLERLRAAIDTEEFEDMIENMPV